MRARFWPEGLHARAGSGSGSIRRRENKCRGEGQRVGVDRWFAAVNERVRASQPQARARKLEMHAEVAEGERECAVIERVPIHEAQQPEARLGG